ncbi:hypothetical protein Fmac_025372 [Flemingia macrophylla]|uniref:Uncharacterized protein n=1 Tax=Flemingia macrophylla TaxID=520843 RepID=A0ABD1LS34_9FABA
MPPSTPTFSPTPLAALRFSTRSASSAPLSVPLLPTLSSRTLVTAWFDCTLELVRQFRSYGLVLLDKAYRALEFFTQKKHSKGYFPATISFVLYICFCSYPTSMQRGYLKFGGPLKPNEDIVHTKKCLRLKLFVHAHSLKQHIQSLKLFVHAHSSLSLCLNHYSLVVVVATATNARRGTCLSLAPCSRYPNRLECTTPFSTPLPLFPSTLTPSLIFFSQRRCLPPLPKPPTPPPPSHLAAAVPPLAAVPHRRASPCCLASLPHLMSHLAASSPPPCIAALSQPPRLIHSPSHRISPTHDPFPSSHPRDPFSLPPATTPFSSSPSPDYFSPPLRFNNPHAGEAA